MIELQQSGFEHSGAGSGLLGDVRRPPTLVGLVSEDLSLKHQLFYKILAVRSAAYRVVSWHPAGVFFILVFSVLIRGL